ncbi:hypothetical protein niasHS_012450 [Heterodera schachtii]|uniref:Uncharacterized protein n=1 Tax=Heterodera schachtii TaxID=97005 RepID=A0ABD2IR93_HETSC
MTPKNLSQKPLNFAQFESQLMNTVVALCTQRTPFDNLDGFLQSIDAIRIRISVADQFVLASSLWNVYTQIADAQPGGILVDFELLLAALSASLSCGSPDLSQNAISAVLYFVERVGFSACAIARRLCSLIINAKDISDKIRVQSLSRLNSILSVSSMVHEHFDKYATQLVQLLRDDEQIPMELVDLVVSLVETSVSLLKIPVLVFLQKQVCLSALSKNPSIGVMKLLNALLEHNHEGVPLPIQAAVSVFQQDYFAYQNNADFRAVLARGRAISQMITRPRRVSNCPSLHTKTNAGSDEAQINIANCSVSTDGLQRGGNTKLGQNNETATTSNATIFMDDSEDNEEEDEPVCEREDGECVEEECFEDGASFSEDIITLDDDEEEIATKSGSKTYANSSKGDKAFSLKTVDDLLMDFTDE